MPTQPQTMHIAHSKLKFINKTMEQHRRLRPKKITTKIDKYSSLVCVLHPQNHRVEWVAMHGNNEWQLEICNLKTYFSGAFHPENKTIWTSMPSDLCADMCVCAVCARCKCISVSNFPVAIFRSFNYHYHATTTVYFNEKIIRWQRGRGRDDPMMIFLKIYKMNTISMCCDSLCENFLQFKL